jgi:hypothetical protein
MDTSQTLDLSDKVVYIYQINKDHEVTLQNPNFEEHNGKLFLVGTIPDGGSSNDWLSGLKAYVSWTHITEIIVFDSLEDYLDRLSRGWNKEQFQ